MIRALMKLQWEIFKSIFTGAARVKKKQSKGAAIGFSLLMLYSLGALMFLFYQIFSMMAAPFAQLQIGWFYFLMCAIISFAIMFIGSVFTAKAQLFEAKDNERLLAMPVTPQAILISRMLMLYLLNLMLGLLVALPAILVWMMQSTLSILGIGSFILLLLALPLLSLSVSALVAWLVSVITSRVQKKSLFSMIFSLAFLGVYFVFCARMNVYLTALVENGQVIAGKLGAVAPLYWIGSAIAYGNGMHLLGSLLVMTVPFVLTCWILSKTFFSIVMRQPGIKHVTYRKTALKVSSAKQALLQRELRRIASSADYMLNAGLGIAFLLVAAVVGVIKRRDLLQMLSMMNIDIQMISVVLVLVICGLLSMSVFSAASVSMEGKNYWIVRSIPVDTKLVLQAKVRTSNLLLLPVVILCSVTFAVCLKLPAMHGVLVVLVCILFGFLMGQIGLFENLRHPNLDWISPNQAVKQSLSVLFTMLLGMAVVLAMGFLWFFLLKNCLDVAMYLVLWAGILGCGNILLYRWLQKQGVARFEMLG